MFGLFKKKEKETKEHNYFPISTDMHSHILPGIDDGSPDVDTSISLIEGLMKLGITKSIATPHIIGDMYPNNAETISRALTLLKTELKKREINFEVSAAAEYMLDAYFLELLQKKVPLLTVKDNIILTEFPYATMPDFVEQMTFAIITDGYSPILAHPERYAYVQGNYKLYHRWAELGFMLQVNLLSLTGYYGKDALKSAQYLIKNDLVSYIGTDLHHPRHMEALSSGHNREIFQKWLGVRTWNTTL